jgi:hypothetical protein
VLIDSNLLVLYLVGSTNKVESRLSSAPEFTPLKTSNF